jgi:hypothetical protein
MAPTTPFGINPSLRILWSGTGDEGAAGAVAVATEAKKKQEKQATGGLKSDPTPPPLLRRSSRTKAGGGDPGEGTPRKKPRGEGHGYVFRADRLIAEAATKPLREDTSSEDGDVKAGAYDEGFDGDEVAASAVRRAHAASVPANNDKAAASAARRARAAIAA